MSQLVLQNNPRRLAVSTNLGLPGLTRDPSISDQRGGPFAIRSTATCRTVEAGFIVLLVNHKFLQVTDHATSKLIAL